MLRHRNHTSEAREASDRVHCFADLWFLNAVLGCCCLGEAMMEMSFQKEECHGLEGMGGGRDLGEGVDAVGLFLDHPGDASDLSLDPAKAIGQRDAVGSRPVRVLSCQPA